MAEYGYCIFCDQECDSYRHTLKDGTVICDDCWETCPLCGGRVRTGEDNRCTKCGEVIDKGE